MGTQISQDHAHGHTRSLLNPLSLEERVTIPACFIPDIKNYHQVSDDRKPQHLLSPSSRITPDHFSAIAFYNRHVFSLIEELVSSAHIEVNYVKKKEIEEMVKMIGALKFCEVGFLGDYSLSFPTSKPLLYGILHKLISNGANAAGPSGRVTVRVERFFDSLPALYHGAVQSKKREEYIKISVRDNGEGFPSGKRAEDMISYGPLERRSHGYGLYSVDLMCKALGTSFTVASRPGQTEISLYHPRDLDAMHPNGTQMLPASRGISDGIPLQGRSAMP